MPTYLSAPHETPQEVLRLKEAIKLYHGLDEQDAISDEKISHVQHCFEHFAQAIKDYNVPKLQSRIIGTYTLRQASNSYESGALSQKLLGLDVDIISGEEARLVYKGAQMHWPHEKCSGYRRWKY